MFIYKILNSIIEELKINKWYTTKHFQIICKYLDNYTLSQSKFFLPSYYE